MCNGIIYVLSNPAMPGIVKIGKTTRDVELRLNELYQTGTPLPFECVYAARVEDESKVERALHLAFDPQRVNPRREFFSIQPEQAVTILELLAVEDVTPVVQENVADVDSDAREAIVRFKSARKAPMKLSQIGIMPGTVLTYTDGDATCVVVNDKQVEYNGSLYSLSGLAQELMGYPRSVRGSMYFTYQGKRLSDMYDELSE